MMSERELVTFANEQAEILGVDPCQWFHSAHALITAMARKSGPIKAIGLRTAAGAITQARKAVNCP